MCTRCEPRKAAPVPPQKTRRMIYNPTDSALINIGGNAKGNAIGVNNTGAPAVSKKYRQWRKATNAIKHQSRKQKR
jgi:hypothetical protein